MHSFDAQADALLAQMTLEEKIAQLGHQAPAIERLGLPEHNWWNEGMHGISRAGIATVFPQSIAMAAAWDPEALQRVADVVSTEARAKHHEFARHGDRGIYKGLSLWSPNINLYRDPRWGRGHETYGEDPYLTGQLVQAFVRGAQGDDPAYLKTIATPKHFAVHSGPEKDRHSFNATASARDLNETYLPAFRRSVEAGAASIMGAYNRLNGEACCASAWLLKSILRDEMGFDGFVVSDCGAIADIALHHKLAADLAGAAAQALVAGCDLSCGCENDDLPQALARGEITEAVIDLAVRRLLRARFALGLVDGQKTPWDETPYDVLDSAAHRALAREMAAAGTVLLQNNGVLPLAREITSIAVIGPNARSFEALLANYYGTPSHYVTPLDGIRAAVSGATKVTYAEGCHHTKSSDNSWGERARAGFSEAVIAAERSEVVVLVLGLTALLEGEEGDAANSDGGGDRVRLTLPGVQEDLLRAVLKVGKPVVLVLLNGGCVQLPPEAAQCAAVLEAWYPGEEGGSGLADVLFGDVNPSGRLPVTFYQSVADLPPFHDYSMRERTYRFFSGEAAFPFGFGLSYTRFEYDQFTVPTSVACGADVSLSVCVTNQGSRDGHEVVQLYAGRQLVAFRKVFVARGQRVTVQLTAEARDFAKVHSDGHSSVAPGSLHLSVGGHQPDAVSTRLAGSANLNATVGLLGDEFKILGPLPTSVEPGSA
ncbi:MAG: glycoside hydrolase family 3 C-terminal domain-containing protein [Spirochaetales bacterium]